MKLRLKKKEIMEWNLWEWVWFIGKCMISLGIICVLIGLPLWLITNNDILLIIAIALILLPVVALIFVLLAAVFYSEVLTDIFEEKKE